MVIGDDSETPTPEQRDAAQRWYLGDLGRGYGFDRLVLPPEPGPWRLIKSPFCPGEAAYLAMVRLAPFQFSQLYPDAWPAEPPERATKPQDESGVS